jgi:hypothetical protein
VEELRQILGDSVTRAPWGWMLLITVVIALIRAWPDLSLRAQNARDKLRGEQREDLKSCREEIGELRDELHAFTLKFNAILIANRIMDVEIETHLPESTALRQARAVLAAAYGPIDAMPEDMRDTLSHVR